MKKNYIKPFAEILEFQIKESIMDDEANIGGGVGMDESIPSGEDWGDPWA